jgi:hypothetical protein
MSFVRYNARCSHVKKLCGMSKKGRPYVNILLILRSFRCQEREREM